MKVNVDASLKNDAQLTSIGLVSSDELGSSLTVFSYCFHILVRTPLFIEAKAIHARLWPNNKGGRGF